MGVGKLLIGENEGGAQIFGPNPAVQQFGQILAQRKAKQDADNKYLADILAKGYDPSSLRNDADRQSYLKQYNDIKQSAIEGENEKDPMKKALALANVRQQLGNLSTYAENSKKQGAQEHAWAQSYMQNPTNWDDKALESYRKSKESELNSDGTVKDFTTLQKRVDPQKMDKLYDYLKKSSVENSKWDNGMQTPGEEAGKKGVYVVQKRGVPLDGDNGAFESALHMTSAYPEFGKYLQGRYPTLQAPTPEGTLALQMKQYMQDRGDKEGFYETKEPKFVAGYKPLEPPRPSWLEQYWLNHKGVPYNPNPPGQASSNQLTPIQSSYIQPMIREGLPQLQRFADLANLSAKGLFRPGENIKPEVVNGYHVFHVPDEVKLDKKIDQANKEAEKYYSENPDKKGATLGLFGGKSIPWKESDSYKEDYKDPYTVVKQGGDIPLNPADQTDYAAKVGQLATRLKVPLDAINKTAGAKSGHGEIPKVEVGKNTEYKIKGKSFKQEAVEKAAKASGMTVDEYLKEVNK